MLCKELSEEDVKSLFLPHGHVEDVSILRSADGRSKGNNGRGGGAIKGITKLEKKLSIVGQKTMQYRLCSVAFKYLSV